MSQLRSTTPIKNGLGLQELRAVLGAAELNPSALQAFRGEYPGVEVVLSETDETAEADNPAGWRDALRRGDLDLAFSHNPEPDEFVEAVPVTEDPWVILTRRDSAIADLQRPGFDVLDGLDVVAWTHRWRGQHELEEAWERRGLAPKIVYRTDDNLAPQRLVPAGLGHPRHGRPPARRTVAPPPTLPSPHAPASAPDNVLCP